MSTAVCDACGGQNPPGSQFCQRCHTFLGWDQREAEPVLPPTEELVETRVMPKVGPVPITTRPTASGASTPQTTDTGRSAPPVIVPEVALRVEAPTEPLVVPVDGTPVELPLLVRNLSDIVDGYAVDVGGAPPWLKVASDQLRLLPDTEDRIVVRFQIQSATLVPAGSGEVRLRIRSLSRSPAHAIVAVPLSVPVVDAPVTVRVEPSIVRARDVDTARFAVVIDNAAANRPATLRLTGTDPELAVTYHFDPAEITVGPGESARLRVVTTSPRPGSGRELTRTLTITASEGRRRVDATGTLVQSTSVVVEDPMVELVPTPALVRMRDVTTASVRITVDNRAGQQWATVRLEARDLEHVVRAHWDAAEVRVPPGGTTDVELHLSCPAPEPGTEVTRQVTVTASDAKRTARTELTVVQTASESPMATLALRLDPSVVRLPNRRRGSATVVVDNVRGRLPARVWLRGDDPENALAFTFVPDQLEVPAGQTVTSRLSFTAPRAPGGGEITRAFSVAATDGRVAASASGSIIQSASDRRPWVRVLLTIAGGVAILFGVMLPFAGGAVAALGLDDDAFEQALNVELGDLPALVSVGVLLLVLAGLMVFGLTGRSGRLTRWSALLAAAVLVAAAVIFGRFGLDSGVIMIGLGCVLGYIGGLLGRR